MKPLGEVLFRKSGRAKRLRITIKENREVIVTLPKNVSFSYAEKIAREKSDWILKHLSKMKAEEKPKIVFDEKTKFKTRYHKLIIEKENRENIGIAVYQGIIKIALPRSFDITSEEAQQAVRLGVVEALRIEAKMSLPLKVEMFAEKFGLSYNRVFIKNLKTRWGSCSNRNNINLNLHLMRLPERLIDYVVLHELAHTVEKNHGKEFWALLETFVKDARKIDKELGKYSTKNDLNIYG
ncbi:MAG: M48 family metallopeptidase [Chlorobi bacterium]|nr:M48 family metallopeptidase [Chlorobiota bacterium]